MGAIIGALIGRHFHREEEKRQHAQSLAIAPITSFLTDPIKSPYTPEDVDNAIEAGTKLDVYPKEYIPFLRTQLEKAKAMRAAAQTLGPSSPPKPDMGVPLMPGASTGSAFGPGPQAQAQPQQPPQPIPVPPAANPYAPTAAPAMTQGLTPSPPPGLPPMPGTPPFANGADNAGPAPIQNESPATKAASVAGGNGFGGPTVTAAAAPAAPVAPADTFHPFWVPSRTATDVGRIEGEQAAAKALPGLEQTQRLGEARVAQLRQSKAYQDLPPRQKIMAEQAAYFGHPLALSPEFFRNIPGITESTAEDTDLQGRPIGIGVPGKRTITESGSFFTPESGRLAKMQRRNPDGTTTTVYVNGFTGRPVQVSKEVQDQLTSVPVLRMIKVDMGDGTTHEMGVNPATGQVASDDPRLVGVNAAMLPTQNDHFMLITKPDGSTDLQPVTTTSGKVGVGRSLPPPPGGGTAPAATPAAAPAAAPGATPPAPAPAPGRGARLGGAAIPAGGRPLPPAQQIKNAQVAEQLNNTIGTIKDIQNKVPMLASMFTAGKVGLQVDPHQGFWRGIINKNMSLTPEEAQLAADWQLLTEGVMQMRIPLGGGGFKGPEGFGAIQSNKGILSQHPEIIRRVLDGTLREFRAQRQPLVDGAKKYGYEVKPEYDEGFRQGLTPPPEKTYSWTGSDGKTRRGAIPKADEAEFLRLHPEAKAQ